MWNAYTLCNILKQNVAQRGCEFQMELLNMPIHLKITHPLKKTCSKSSTEGVCILNGASHCTNLRSFLRHQYYNHRVYYIRWKDVFLLHDEWRHQLLAEKKGQGQYDMSYFSLRNLSVWKDDGLDMLSKETKLQVPIITIQFISLGYIIRPSPGPLYSNH